MELCKIYSDKFTEHVLDLTKQIVSLKIETSLGHNWSEDITIEFYLTEGLKQRLINLNNVPILVKDSQGRNIKISNYDLISINFNIEDTHEMYVIKRRHKCTLVVRQSTLSAYVSNGDTLWNL